LILPEGYPKLGRVPRNPQEREDRSPTLDSSKDQRGIGKIRDRDDRREENNEISSVEDVHQRTSQKVRLRARKIIAI
jgi:hypothetical protein